MNRLVKVSSKQDIFPQYRNTPIALLLEYHNLSREIIKHENAQLIIGMCIDNRKHLHIPENFAYIIRAGGANMRNSEFNISYAISVGNVRHLALIGHNNCGMVNLTERKEIFTKGLVEIAGWGENMAQTHFEDFVARFEIVNELSFVLNETRRLRQLYPKIQIAPLMYLIENNKLYLIEEN